MNIRDIPFKVRITLEEAVKNYKLKKFRNLVYENKNLRILLNSVNSFDKVSLFNTENEKENMKFKTLSNELCKKELINSMDFILKAYLDYYPLNIKINSREILSAWMIYNYKGILEDYNEKEYILQFSKELIEQFTILIDLPLKISYDIIKFNKIFINYYDSLIIFKEKDKIDKLNYFITEWKNLEGTKLLIMNSEKYSIGQKSEVLNIIEIDKKKIKNYILKLNSNYDFDNLKRIIENTKNLKKKIIDNYKNILESELNFKRYDIFNKILNEFKSFLNIFNSAKRMEYEEKIDAEFYCQLMNVDLIGINDLYNFGDYLINEIIKFGSKSLEEVYIDKWNEFKNDFKNDHSNINKTISFMLIFTMEIIEEIKMEINDYKLLLEILNENNNQ